MSRRSPPPPFPGFGNNQQLDDMETPSGSGNGRMGYAPPPRFTLHQPLPQQQEAGGGEASSAFTTPIQQQQLGGVDTGDLLYRGPAPEDSMQRFQHRPQDRRHQFELAGLGMQHSDFDEDDSVLGDSSITPLGKPGGPPPLPLSLDNADSAYYTTPTRPEDANSDMQAQQAEEAVVEVDQDFILNLNQEGDLERLTRKAVGETRVAWKKEIMGRLRQEVDQLDEDQWLFAPQ
ncbi:hypothetical protein GQ54DRAFT_51476 [Martensiomyces pterosporus]|nr:hypothetical protein GQ54DRAFT_51476 [Martensiomyces pterosporus]